MRRKRVVLGFVAMAGLALLTSVPVHGHHAFAAEFDATKPVRVEGTIVKVEWTNPHTWFHVDSVGADGQVEHWMFEGGGPYALIKRGFTKDYLGTAGTSVVGGRIPVQGRAASRQRALDEISGWAPAFRGLVGHRRTGRWEGSVREMRIHPARRQHGITIPRKFQRSRGGRNERCRGNSDAREWSYAAYRADASRI